MCMELTGRIEVVILKYCSCVVSIFVTSVTVISLICSGDVNLDESCSDKELQVMK